MHKNEFIKQVAKETALSRREVSQVLEASIDLITKSLQRGEKVVLTGFGTFEVRNRRERRGVNPKTKEYIIIPGTQTPGFTASNSLKMAVVGATVPTKISDNFAQTQEIKDVVSAPAYPKKGRKLKRA